MLILTDFGGVVASRGFWLLWDFLEKEFKIKSDDSKKHFLKNYEELFSGKMSYKTFWDGFEKELKLSKGTSYWNEKLLEFFKPQQEVIQIFDELRKKGNKLILLSDQVTELFNDLDKKYDFSSHFDDVILSSKIGLSKPNPEIYKYALKLSDSTPQDTIFIDDLDQNLITARELGIKTILFETPQQLRNDLLCFIKI